MSKDRGYSPHNGVVTSTPPQMVTGANLKQATLTEIWEDLKSGIESVYSQQTMSKPRYMTLYSYVLILIFIKKIYLKFNYLNKNCL